MATMTTSTSIPIIIPIINPIARLTQHASQTRVLYRRHDIHDRQRTGATRDRDLRARAARCADRDRRPVQGLSRLLPWLVGRHVQQRLHLHLHVLRLGVDRHQFHAGQPGVLLHLRAQGRVDVHVADLSVAGTRMLARTLSPISFVS